MALKLVVSMVVTTSREGSAAANVVSSPFIGKLKDIRDTFLWKFSDEDIEEKRTEAISLWEPTGNRQPLSALLMNDNALEPVSEIVTKSSNHIRGTSKSNVHKFREEQ